MAQMMMERIPEGLEDGKEEISATEELASEHGMLDRIMLAMDRKLKMAGAGGKADLSVINMGCGMIKQLVDQHHMVVEEEHIYPRFENTELADFADVLKNQHNEMRKMVSRMENLSKTGAVRDRSEMEELNRLFRDFHDMVMAHAAWEQTVLFPVMAGTWSKDELEELKEKQEEHEKKLLGKDATEKAYTMLMDLEKSAGISGLDDFTRRLK
jgi:hemerythrin-like domain-containing protein